MHFCFVKADPNLSPIKGIFHCSGNESFTKYEMSCIMADLFNLRKEHIEPDTSSALITTGPNLRPKDVRLDTSYSNEQLGFNSIMKFRNSIKDCLETFV